MQLKLTTISPVHIGKGEEIQVSDYALENGYYYRLNIDKAFDVIDQHGFFDKVIQKIDETSTRLSEEKDNKIQSQIRQELNLLALCRQLSPKMYDELRSKLELISDYYFPERIPKKRNDQSDNEDKYNSIVGVQLKTADRQTYIPGSSLKGAIRTALISRVISKLEKNEMDEIVAYINQSLDEYEDSDKDYKTKTRILSALDDKLISMILFCGVKVKDRNGHSRIRFDDAKFDLLKLIRISDTNTLPATDSLALMPPVQYSAINGRQELRHPLEAIESNRDFDFNLRVDMDFLLEAKKRFGRYDKKFDKDETEWIDFRNKVERLFNFSLDDFHENNKTEIEQKIIAHVLKVCYQFYGDVLNHDVQWIKRAVKNDENLQSLYKVYNFLQDLRKSQLLLMKLSFGSGFHAKTLMLEMKKHNEHGHLSLKESMQDLMETMEVGKPRGMKGEYHVNLDKFPTSRVLVEAKNSFDSFGWVAITDNQGLSKEQQVMVDKIVAQLQKENMSENLSTTSSVKNYNDTLGFGLKKSSSTDDSLRSKRLVPKDVFKAEIINDVDKPAKVRILEGEYIGQETIFPGVNLKGLDLTIGSSVLVKLVLSKKRLIKAAYYSKAR